MAKMTGEQYAAKHAARLKASIQEMRDGVNRLTVSPTEQAAAKQDKMLARLTEKINDGTWSRRLRAVSLDDWRQKYVNVGIGRIPAGIDAAHDKVAEFGAQLMAHIDKGLSEIKSMPDITVEDGIARAAAMIRHNATFRRR